MKKKRILLLGVLLASSLMTLFAQFSADKVYTIECNNQSGKYMQDNGDGYVVPKAMNNNSFWQLVATANEGCYYVKNVKTGRYMQKTSEYEVSVKTGDTPVEIYIKNDPAKGTNVYGLASTDRNPHDFANDNTYGANYTSNYVQGFSAALGGRPNSFWKIVEANSLKSSTGQTIWPCDEVFIYNVETGYWLQNNNRQTVDWNSHAELDPLGFTWQLLGLSSGWQLNPMFANNHSMNASNLYMDTSAEVTTWTLEPKEVQDVSNAYTIKSGDVVLGATNDKFIAKGTNNSSWQLVTWAERLASTMSACETASGDNSVDLTWLIPGSQFNIVDEHANKLSRTIGEGTGAAFVSGQTQGNGIREIWNNANGFDINYTLTNLPAGIYRFTVSGYYRDGGVSGIGEKHKNGTENLRAIIYANEKNQALMSVCAPERTTSGSGCDTKTGDYYIPNNVGNAAIATRNGIYVNTPLKVIVDESGTLTIGVRKDGGVTDDWTILDYFKLQYFGPNNIEQYLALLNASISEAEAFDQLNTTGALATVLQNAINAAKDARSYEDTDEIEAATAVLDAALNNAKNLNVSILRATVTLASAEGVDVTAANNFITNGTSVDELNSVLSALRIARRIKNSEKDTHNWAGNEPAAGEFYLYNVGQQRFFCGGDDWGAHAALGFPGIIVKLETVSDGVYRINTHLQNGKDGDNNKEYLNYGGYCDTWNADETKWVFVSANDGKYNIARNSNNGLLLGYSTNTYNRLDTDKSGGDNPDNQWKLVTKADRDALLATATEDAPQDASYLIKSPGFSQREDVSAWTLKGGASIWGRGSNHPDFAIEAYDKTSAGVEQTVTGLPAGTYELKVQAFYRDGSFAKQEEILAGGGDACQLATLYAGTKSALIQNVSGGADKAPGMGRASSVGYMPDGIDDACLYFQSGLYWASLDEIVVGKDGTMTIGARKTEKQYDGDWMVLDNFRLIYKGASVDLSGVKADLLAKIGEANNLMDALDLRLSFLKTLAGNGQNVYDNSNDLDEIVNATNALQTAINQVNNVTNLTAFIQTAAKATNEGVDANDAKAAVEAVTEGTTFASVVSAQIYNLTSARKVKALGKSDIYTGVAPVAGKYRLYNLGTGMFLGMGSEYNTHAAVDQVGIEVELVAEGDDFFLKTIYGNQWFNADPFVDTPESDRAIYSFAVVSGNVYTIKQGERLLGWNPNVKLGGVKHWNTIANTNDASADDANFQWKLVNEAEFEAILATAAADNAVDVSYMINNPSFNRLPNFDMWQKEVTGGNGGARVNTPLTDNNGNRAADYGYEFFNTDNFSYTQKLTGLKPGKYQVSVQAFYRDGDGAHQKQLLENDEPSAQAAYLYANGSQEYLPNVSSVRDLVPGIDMGRMMESTKGAFPNYPDASFEYFEHGAYLTTVEAQVGSNGELTLGVKKDTRPHEGDWVVLDNFRLTYLGTPLNINTMSIVGDFTGGWEFTNDKLMTMDANDPNIWTYVIEDFKAEARTYDYKVTANEQWGVYEKPSEFDPKNDSGNAEFTFGTEGYPAGHYRLVFTVNTSTHELSLDVQKPTVTISENADYEADATEDALILLNRTFANDKIWNTFVVPFNISNSELKRAFGDDVEVAEYTEESADANNVTVRFQTMGTPAITANLPVLLQTNTTETNFLFKSDIIEDMPKSAGTNFDFVGSYAAETTIPNGEFFLSGNKIYKSKGATTLKSTRAYFKAKTDGARIVTLLFDNEGMTTAISENFKVKSEKPATIYDLQGRKLSTVKKGVYIVDGKKVVK